MAENDELQQLVAKLNNPFLQRYVRYVHNTEPPIMMHIWSAISALGACMGRHVYYDMGIGKRFANNYILLVGRPATRKGTAASIAVDLVKAATDVNFAPDDTGGQRQGLLSAMIENAELESDVAELSIADLVANIDKVQIRTNGVDKHTLYATAYEFGSLIGQNNLDMTRFLIRMWDGDDYKYQLSEKTRVLEEPLLSILGCTTSTELSIALPPEAMGQGYMSRNILVFAREKTRSIYRPSFDNEQRPWLLETLRWAHEELHGEMGITDAANAELEQLYNVPTHINDGRFVFYSDRRHTHLVKTVMALCAGRRSDTINLDDVRDANAILTETEKRMPEALGEYGMSPVSLAKQRTLEFIQAAGQPITKAILWSFLQRDVRISDFELIMTELVNAGKVNRITLASGGVAYVAVDELVEIVSGLSDTNFDELISSMIADANKQPKPTPPDTTH